MDNLSIKPELKVNGETRFHTNLSVILSLISAMGIVAISCIFMNEWLSKKKINLVYNLDSRKYSTISLEGKHLAVLVTDTNGIDIPDYDRVMNIEFKYLQVVIPTGTNNPSANSMPLVTYTTVPANDCKTYEKLNPVFGYANKNFKNTVCFDFEKNKVSLTGKFGALQGYTNLDVRLNKCVNSTLNNNNCMPTTYINQVLAFAILNVFSTEYDIIPEDLDNPVQQYDSFDQLRISASVYKRFDKKYNKIFVNYDRGLLTPAIEVMEAYRTDNIYESVDLRNGNNGYNDDAAFSALGLQFSGKNEIFNISFMKLPQALANVGGILNLTLISGKVLMYFWSMNSMLEFVISKVISAEERERYFNFLKENSNKNFDFSFKNITNRISIVQSGLNLNNLNPNDGDKDNNTNNTPKGQNMDLIKNLNANAAGRQNRFVKSNNYFEVAASPKTPKTAKKDPKNMTADNNNCNHSSNYSSNVKLNNLSKFNQLNENEIKVQSGNNENIVMDDPISNNDNIQQEKMNENLDLCENLSQEEKYEVLFLFYIIFVN